MSRIIIGMTRDVATAYDSIREAGIDDDLAFLKLVRLVPVEIVEIDDEQDEQVPDEQVEDIDEEPIENEVPPVENPVESISQN